MGSRSIWWRWARGVYYLSKAFKPAEPGHGERARLEWASERDYGSHEQVYRHNLPLSFFSGFIPFPPSIDKPYPSNAQPPYFALFYFTYPTSSASRTCSRGPPSYDRIHLPQIILHPPRHLVKTPRQASHFIHTRLVPSLRHPPPPSIVFQSSTPSIWI